MLCSKQPTLVIFTTKCNHTPVCLLQHRYTFLICIYIYTWIYINTFHERFNYTNFPITAISTRILITSCRPFWKPMSNCKIQRVILHIFSSQRKIFWIAARVNSHDGMLYYIWSRGGTLTLVYKERKRTSSYYSLFSQKVQHTPLLLVSQFIKHISIYLNIYQNEQGLISIENRTNPLPLPKDGWAANYS